MEKTGEKELLFRSSSVCAGFTDDDYNVILKTNSAVPLQKEQIKAAKYGGISISGGSAVLKSVDVEGGHFYWTEDKSGLLKLNEELSETGDYPAEENAVQNEAARIEEAHKRTLEQNRLFDSISRELQPQLNKIEEILNGLPDDRAGFCREMKYAGVLGAYVKRYSNLLLLSAAESRTDSFELYLCINESLSYLRLLDIFCCADIQQGIELSVSCELLMYELFEAVTEAALPLLPVIFVTLRRDENGLTYYIEAANENVVINRDFFDKAKSAGFTLHTEISDGCFFAVMTSDPGYTL